MTDLRGPGALVPPGAERYLHRVVAPEATHLRTATLRLRGERRLGRRWVSFTATHALAPLQGFVAEAELRLGSVVVARTRHRLLDGRISRRWRLFGFLPASPRTSEDEGARGLADRLAADSAWLPSALTDEAVVWSEGPGGWIRARWTVGGQPLELGVDVDPTGLPRALRVADRVGAIDAVGAFHGVTIPTRVAWDDLRVVVVDLEPGPLVLRG